jgi:hypothetical protein
LATRLQLAALTTFLVSAVVFGTILNVSMIALALALRIAETRTATLCGASAMEQVATQE